MSKSVDPKVWWSNTQALAIGSLRQSISCDVVIAGGGFLGLSLALSLATRRLNTSIVLLEARDVGAGSSGRAGGVIVSADELPGSVHDHRFLSMFLKKYHIECEFGQDQDPLADIDGEYDHDCLNPRQFLDGLTERAQSAGVRVFCNSTVKSASVTRDGVVLSGADFAVSARACLLAVGAYAPQMTILSSELAVTAETCVVVRRPSDRLVLPKTFYARKARSSDFVWGRRIAADHFLFGGGEKPYIAENCESQDLAETLRWLRATVPLLSDAEVICHWRGLFARFRDGMGPRLVDIHPSGLLMYYGGFDGVGIAAACRAGNRLSRIVASRIQA